MRPAIRLFPRSADATFERSTLGVTFPAAVVAADSWWRFDPTLDVEGGPYKKRIADINERLHAASVDGCPDSCCWEPDLTGCNQTHRCGSPY